MLERIPVLGAGESEGFVAGDGLTLCSDMTRILVMSETRSLADAKAHFSEIVDLVEREQERVVITKHGRPVAVIMSPDDLESLEETLDIMATPGALEEIREADAEIDRGEYFTAAELRAKYLTKP